MLGCIKNYAFYAAEIHYAGFFKKNRNIWSTFWESFIWNLLNFFTAYLFLENLKLIYYHKLHCKEFLTAFNSA